MDRAAEIRWEGENEGVAGRNRTPDGGEELAGVHGKAPTDHVTTRGRHQERERSMTNSPRRLSSTMRHGRAWDTVEQMATATLGFHGGGAA